MNNKNEQNKLYNTFKDAPERKYVQAPKGLHIAGLVNIVNSQRENQRDDGTKVMADTFIMTFRLKKHPECTVRYEVTASTNEKGNLYKQLKLWHNLQEGEYLTADQAFKLLCASANKWYQIFIEHTIIKGGPNAGKPYAKIGNHTILPHTEEEAETPLMFFALVDEASRNAAPNI